MIKREGKGKPVKEWKETKIKERERGSEGEETE